MATNPLERLDLVDYPRSNLYDRRWILDNQMGTNPLWMAENIWADVDIPAGSRVLDLGCGTALTSIFLAREYGLQVTAADLWVDPSDNWRRVKHAGLEQSVFPVHAEAHDLPFAHNYFDAILSIDAYHFFGTSERYLHYITKFLRPGGTIGIVVPGLTADVHPVPEHVEPFLIRRPYLQTDYWTFHSADWWRRHWSHSADIDVTNAELIGDGWRWWLLWEEVCLELGMERASRDEVELISIDAGRHIGLVKVVAQKLEPQC